jgi:hypothetical protein
MKSHIIGLAIGVAFATSAFAQATSIDVKKSSGCGCCIAWINALTEDGFAATGEDIRGELLSQLKLDSGVPPLMTSCHTAFVEGYVIEGHVPPADIRRLLDERPEAIGLAVPGMPYGAPGMGPEDDRDAYDVFLINGDGSTAIFTSYAEN